MWQCADILQVKGFKILSICSSNLQAKEWADKHGINFYDSHEAFVQKVNSDTFDFLFSIVNRKILPGSIIERAQFLAINYHDSLLPRYAGVHATSWAILNGEKTHGITWHVMDTGIDSGDILKQAIIKISNDETAASLNLKCHEEAIKLFDELVNDILDDCFLKTMQDLSLRTYNGLYKKPSVAGIIDWNSSIDEIDRLNRATQFGGSTNRFCLCNFAFHGELLHAKHITIEKHRTGIKPGRILKKTKTELLVSAINGLVHLDEIVDMQGLSWAPKKVNFDSFDLNPNYKDFIAEEFSLSSKYEDFWVERLNNYKPILLPKLLPTGELRERKFKLKKSHSNKISSKKKEYYYASVFFTYLYIINNYTEYSIILKDFGFENNTSIFFSNNKPLNVKFSSGESLKAGLEFFIKEIEKIDQTPRFSKDLFLRRPELKDLLDSDFENPSVIITINKNRVKRSLRGSYILWVDFTNNETTINVNKKYVEKFKSFDASSIERGISLLHKQIERDSSLLLSNAIILDKSESSKLIKFSTGPSLKINYGFIGDLFGNIVHKFKNKIAVIEDNVDYTYIDLEKKVGNLVSHFYKLGIRSGDCVPVMLEPGYNYIASILSLIMMKVAYVPLDPEFPTDRIQYILNSTNAKYMITDEKNSSSLYKFVDIHTLSVSDLMEVESAKFELMSWGNKEIPACVMYTSGSTGVPKGVIVTHKNIISLALNKHVISIRDRDRIAQASNCCFDSSTFEIWCTLLNGASLVIIKRNILLSPNIFLNFVKDKGITVQFFTPTLFNFYVNEQPQIFKYIKIVKLGGEQVNMSICKYLLTSDFSPRAIYNCYGPTETTAFVSAKKISLTDMEAYGIVSIGRPISNTKIYILDNYMKFVPIGASGEVYIAGNGVTLGYTDHSLTESKFIELNKTKERVYKTGDFARWLNNGEIEFLGRSDNQVKVRGYRIELDEVRLKILSLPEVSEAYITSEKTPGDQTQLIVFVIARRQNITPKIIKEKLLSKLPIYMVPAKIIVVKEFPMTLSGKVDSKKLLDSICIKNDDYQLEINSNDSIINIIITVIKNVLKSNSVKALDNFFELGGDSITAMYVSSELYKKDILLKPSEVFKYPRILDLVKVVKDKKESLKKVSYGKLLPTPIQEWFFSTIKNNNSEFSQLYSGYVAKKINIEVLIKATQLYFNNRTFSVRYKKNDNNWVSFVSHKANNLSIEISKKSLVVSKILSAKIDITNGPVVAALLSHEAIGGWKLSLLVHHLYVDGVSWSISIDRIYRIYKDLIHSRFPKITDDLSDLKNWTNKLNQYANSQALKEEVPFWLGIIKRKNKTISSYIKGHAVEKNKAILKFELKKPLSNQITRITKRHQSVSTQMVLLSTLLLSYKVWSKNESLLLDLESHGREELEGLRAPTTLVGWFTSIYPISFDLEMLTQTSFLECLQVVKSSLAEIPRGGIGYGLLRYLCKENNDIKKSKIPEIGFNYLGNLDLNYNEKNFIKPGFQPITLINGKGNRMPHLIDVMCWVSQGVLKFEWDYSSKHFKKSNILRWINIYQFYLEKIIEYLYSNRLPLLKPDYPLLKLSQEELSAISNSYDVIEKIYPLSQIQMGLLYHAINHQTSDSYFIQQSWRMRVKVNPNRIIDAWANVFEYYPILRSIFLWNGLSEPVQIISKLIKIPIVFHDFSEMSFEAQENYISELMQSDRLKLFNISKEACIRITLLKINNENYHCLLSCHHILIDAWSISLIISKFMEFCSKIDVDVQKSIYYVGKEYDDYIHWLKSQSLSKARKFWTSEFKGFNGINELKIKRTILKTRSDNRPIQQEYFVSDNLKKRVDDFVIKHKITLNTLIQTAWIYLVSFYSQNNDITIGVTLSLRPATINNIDKAVGLLINTVPFRFKLSSRRSIQNDFLSVQSKMPIILEYGYSSLAEIQSWSGLAAGRDLFETLLVFENTPGYDLVSNDLSIENVSIRDATHYPLTLLVVPAKRLQLKIVYDASFFDEDVIKDVFMRFERILSSIVLEPNANYLGIDYINSGDLQESFFKNTKLSTLKYDSFLEPLEIAVKSHLDSIAIVDYEGSLDYKTLNALSNQLAYYLIKQKLRKGTLVGVALSRSRWITITFLAILKAGGAYVPIDPSYPKKRIDYMLEKSGSTFLITDDTVANELKQQFKNLKIIRKINILNVNKLESTLTNYPRSNPQISIKPKHLAHVIYTSGSTGKPKGVMISHQNLLNVLMDVKKRFHITHKDRWLAVTPISFDISGIELFLPLLSGACCVLANAEAVSNGHLTNELVKQHKITILQATPITWKLLLLEDWKPVENFKAICTGEALSADLARKLTKICGGVWNMYGPTETTIWSTGTYVTAEAIKTPTTLIGKPLLNTEILVLDKKRCFVPIGMAGELYIGGSGVSQGYWKEKHLTGERFIKNPFNRNGSKIYKTGDLVRWLPDGNLEFIGRIDHQVKLNGLRIELSAIEARLLEHPAIHEAVVVLHKQENVSTLIAYVVKKNKKMLGFSNVIRFLSDELPVHMLPTQLIELTDLPLSPSGKIDRAALEGREIFINANDKKNAGTTIEKALFDIWENLLQRRDFGINDNFFDLGGHSILVIQLISNIKKTFNVTIQIRNLFEYPDIERLAELVERLALGSEENIKKAAHFHQTNKKEHSFIIPLQLHGNKTPLFLIHPVGGTVFWYLSLAKYVVDRPLYAIQDPGIETQKTLFSSIEEMATYYLQAIRNIQPKGPYLLGGASMGANIAVEITNQFEAQGESISFLALLDGWAIYPEKTRDKAWFKRTMLKQRKIMQQQLRLAGLDLKDEWFNIQWHRSKILAKHETPIIQTDITLFKAKEIASIFKEYDVPSNYWTGNSSRSVNVHLIPGNHETMFQEPNASVLGRVLQETLKDVD